MPYLQTAEPATLAVNFAELKAHCRVTDSVEDALLRTYAQAAIDLIEIETSRAMIQRTFRYETSHFPGVVQIPVAPFVSVQSVQYYDSAGAFQTFDEDSYAVDTTSLLGRVTTAPGSVWPFTQSQRLDAVQINFTAGYGESPDLVPAGLRMVVLFLAGHFFVNRVPVSNGAVMTQIPRTLQNAIDAYKIWKA